MVMKITAGVGRKLGLPEFSSVSANCHVEFEADNGLLNDPQAFHQRVRAAFAACQQAVAEELARQQQGQGAPVPNGRNNGRNDSATSAAAGNGHRNGTTGHAASEKQLDFARQLAKAIPGLGIRRLEALTQKMYGKSLVTLTSLNASGLIDTLKSIKDGEIDAGAVLGGEAT
jgi:hypothetical protein